MYRAAFASWSACTTACTSAASGLGRAVIDDAIQSQF